MVGTISQFILSEFQSLDCSNDVKFNALSLILKILDNIINQPNESKFRTIKRTGASYQSKILLNGDIRGVIIEQLLLACGFVLGGSSSSNNSSELRNSSENLELPSSISVEHIRIQREQLQHLLIDSPSNSTEGKNPSKIEKSEKTEKPDISPSSAKASSIRRKLPNEPAEKLEETLKSLRVEQAEKFRQRQYDGNSCPREHSENDDSNEQTRLTRNGNTTSNRNGNRSAVRGFFSSLFGSGGDTTQVRRRNTSTRTSGPQIVTMNDIRPPPRIGG